jgi:hypothetical protein
MPSLTAEQQDGCGLRHHQIPLTSILSRPGEEELRYRSDETRCLAGPLVHTQPRGTRTRLLAVKTRVRVLGREVGFPKIPLPERVAPGELANQRTGAVARGVAQVLVPLPTAQDDHRLMAARHVLTRVQNLLELVDDPTRIHIRSHPPLLALVHHILCMKRVDHTSQRGWERSRHRRSKRIGTEL